jgi:RimJ/RimL family protein N-acetyltransferase
VGNKQFRSRLTAAVAFFRAMEYCFDELNLHRVNAFVYSFNEASWRIIEKIGAVRELTLREHVARDGTLHDVYGYGLLREEFEAFRAKHARATEGIMDTMAEDQRVADATRERAAENVR